MPDVYVTFVGIAVYYLYQNLVPYYHCNQSGQEYIMLPNSTTTPTVLLSVLISTFSLVFGLLCARILLPMALELPYTLGIKREQIFFNWIPYSPTLFIQRKYEIFDNYHMTDFHLISRDYVRKLPEILADIPSLERIYINNNPIQRIPNSLADSPNLRSLYIINGNLTDIPENIGNLTNLEELTLVGNHIKRIPDSIGNLTKLTTLSLAYNDIESLPSSVANMTNLYMLDLTGNKFSEFPKALPPNLRLLFIGGNKIPIKILSNMVSSLKYIIY